MLGIGLTQMALACWAGIFWRLRWISSWTIGWLTGCSTGCWKVLSFAFLRHHVMDTFNHPSSNALAKSNGPNLHITTLHSWLIRVRPTPNMRMRMTSITSQVLKVNQKQRMGGLAFSRLSNRPPWRLRHSQSCHTLIENCSEKMWSEFQPFRLFKQTTAVRLLNKCMASGRHLFRSNIAAKSGQRNTQLSAVQPSFIVDFLIEMAPLRVTLTRWRKKNHFRLISTDVRKEISDICIFAEVNAARQFKIHSSLQTMVLRKQKGCGA